MNEDYLFRPLSDKFLILAVNLFLSTKGNDDLISARLLLRRLERQVRESKKSSEHTGVPLKLP